MRVSEIFVRFVLNKFFILNMWLDTSACTVRLLTVNKVITKKYVAYYNLKSIKFIMLIVNLVPFVK